jgi:hypothetical protein
LPFIPDLAILSGHYDSSSHPLAGRNLICDAKTLSPGDIHKTGKTEFGHAAQTRQEKVATEYAKRAKDLDNELHAGCEPPGPFARILEQFGDVMGLVVWVVASTRPI